MSISSATITRTVSEENWELSEDYKLTSSYSLLVQPSTDEIVTALKTLLVKLATNTAERNNVCNAWGSLLLDTICLKACNQSNWQEPIGFLLPVLLRQGSPEQVEQTLNEFTAENTPVFTNIESFDWGRAGGLYFAPWMWWGFLRRFSTPELKQAFWDKMQDFYEEWEPDQKEMIEDFKEQILEKINGTKLNRITIDDKVVPDWVIKAYENKGCNLTSKWLPKTGLTRDEYVEALKTAASGGEDVTGCWTYLNEVIASGNYHAFKPGHKEAFWDYLIARFSGEPSSAAQALLAATTQDEMKDEIRSMISSGKFTTGLKAKESSPAVTEAYEPPTNEEIFFEAVDSCNFDGIFADADNYQELIEKNIDEIASNFTEENEFCATGNEPEWLMKLLLKAGACVGSEAPEPTPVMQSSEVNTNDSFATLVQRGLDGLEGNAWLSGHQQVASSFFLAEAWDSNMEAVLGDFAQYVHEQEVSDEEYLNAGKPVVEKYVAALISDQKKKDTFQWAWDNYSQQADGDTAFKLLALAYIKRHPEHRDALWEMLFDGDAGSENWEELLSGQWFEEFKDKIELSAKTIDDEWGQGGDYSDFGAEVAEVFRRGLALCTTIQADETDTSESDEVIEDKLLSRYNDLLLETLQVPIPAGEYYVGEHAGCIATGPSNTIYEAFSGGDYGFSWLPSNASDDSMQEYTVYGSVGIYKDTKEKEDKEYCAGHGFWLTIDKDMMIEVKHWGGNNDVNTITIPGHGTIRLFEHRFSEVQELIDYIHENEDFRAIKTDEEIEWVFNQINDTCVLENGAEFKEQIIKEVKGSVSKGSVQAADYSFAGKRVCVTGKLSKTRKEVEALLEAAGAIIAGSISKTTNYLVAGADAGSKLSKAADLGVTVLTEEQMMTTLDKL